MLAACASPATHAAARPTPPAPTTVPTPAVSAPPFACDETVGRPGTVPRGPDQTACRWSMRPASGGSLHVPPQRATSRPFPRSRSARRRRRSRGIRAACRSRSPGPRSWRSSLHGGTALDESYEPTYEGPVDFAPAGSPIVEMKRAGDFEAVSSWVVGLDGPSCVRILPLDGTSRLVIEISTT